MAVEWEIKKEPGADAEACPGTFMYSLGLLSRWDYSALARGDGVE